MSARNRPCYVGVDINYKCYIALLLLVLVAIGSIPISQYASNVKGESVVRFRLGATVPSSVLRGFGVKHGVSISLSYAGGMTFYDYMTKGPGYFAHINIALRNLDFYDWGGEREFLKGLLDAADKDGGRCEISISLYGVDLGWPSLWEAEFLEFLDAVGPNRRSMRYIFLRGEWTYRDMNPPCFDDLKTDFYKAKEMAASYSYQLGWFGEGKYLTNIPSNMLPELYSWGPRVRVGQISRLQDKAKGSEYCYQTANWWERPNDVLLAAFTMWDREANIPNTPPYYICYEKFESFIKGAADRYDASGGAYPQSVLFYIMPETFNDVEGVNCPYLQWWSELAQKYGLRTSRTEPVELVRAPSNSQPKYSFPPYPIAVKIGNRDQNLPPFQVQAGGEFEGYLQARNAHTWQALSNRLVEIYLVKRTLKNTNPWDSYPMEKVELKSMIYIGSVTTRSDGWAYFKFKGPVEAGKYTLVAHVPKTDAELEAFSDFTEFILVVQKAHRVEIRSNIKLKLSFGPSAYGPPWQGVDPERWVEPNKPLWGYCGETTWTFIAPSEVVDSQGKTWKFSRWEDGSTNPKRSIFIDKDLVLEVYYSEPGTSDSRMQSSISCSVSSSEPFKGGVVAISGSVSPPVSGALVTLTYIMPDGSSFKHSITTSSSGSYSENYSPQNLGTYYVQASWSGNEKYKGSSSSWVPFNIIKRSSSITLSLSSDPIAPGDSLGISGVLSPPISKVAILLSYRAQGGSWVTLTNLTADQNGRFSYLWINTPLKAGVYEVKASWLGNDGYDGSSCSVSFSIVEVEKPLEPDFSISVDSPYTVLVIGEREQKITMSVHSKQGFSSDIKLSLSDVPSGVLARLSPSTLALPSNGRGNATLGLYAGWNSSPGNYVLHLVASGGEREHAIDIKLKVALPVPEFAVLINPRIVTMPTLSEYNATLVVGISSESNYTIEPSLSVIGIPNGIEVELDEKVLTIPKHVFGYTNLTLRTSENPPARGNYNFFIECIYRGVVVKEEVTLILVDRIPISLRANLTPVSVHYGDHILLKGNASRQQPSKLSIAIVSENGTEVSTTMITTNASGEFSESLPVLLAEGEYELKLTCDGDDLYLASTLNLSLKVEKADTIVKLWSNATKVGANEPVLLKGTVKTASGKPIQNSDVTIIISGMTSVQSVLAKTDEGGTYAIVISDLGPGEYNITSHVRGNAFYNSAISEQINLEVHDPILPIPSSNLMSILTGITITNLVIAIVSIARKSGSK